MKKPDRREEKKLQEKGYRLIAGIDEVGKGAWAGPLVAAAVILAPKNKIKGINDSKKLTPKKREKLFVGITREALAWSVAVVENDFIDQQGIVKANLKAIKEAGLGLNLQPDYLLIDAVRIKVGKIPTKSIIKGDAKVLSIAAASIVAKVVRDSLMNGYHRLYPKYKFSKHKGYGTKEHHRLIKKHGFSPIHRKSFRPMRGE